MRMMTFAKRCAKEILRDPVNLGFGLGFPLVLLLLLTTMQKNIRLCSEFSVNARFHDKTVHILRSSEPEAEAEPPPMAARSVLDRLA